MLAKEANALQIAGLTASLICEQMGVAVSFSNNATASTNGRSIYFPTDILSTDKNTYDLLIGYLWHEVSHVRDTNFNVLYAIQDTLIKHFVNLLEDVRIELCTLREYPGANIALSKLELLLQQETALEADPIAGESIYSWLYGYLRFNLLNQPTQVIQQHYEPYVDQHWLPIKHTVLDLAIRACKSSGTEQVVRYARNILALMQEYFDSQQNSSAGSTIELQPLSYPQEPSSAQNEDDEGEDGDEGSPQFSAAFSEQFNTQDPDDIGERVKQKLKPILVHQEEPTSTVMPRFITSKALQNNALLKEAVALTHGMSVALRRVLLSRSRAYRSTTDEGFAISQRNLVSGYITGRLYEVKRVQKAVNTRVILMRDDSGSMKNGDAHQIASVAVLATLHALRQIKGVHSAALAFARDDVSVSWLTRFDESVPSTSGRHVANASGGTTPTATAMLGSMQAILGCKKPDERLVIMVVTDGSPDDPRSVDQLIQLCRNVGIEFWGIGIGSERVIQQFPVASVVHNIGDLPQAMMSMCEQRMRTFIN